MEPNSAPFCSVRQGLAICRGATTIEAQKSPPCAGQGGLLIYLGLLTCVPGAQALAGTARQPWPAAARLPQRLCSHATWEIGSPQCSEAGQGLKPALLGS